MEGKLNLDEIVVFGKYKGKPVASLLADTDYCSWLQSQAGIAEKWPFLIKAIRDGFEISNEDHCTPVHNEMQARFLCRGTAIKVLHSLGIDSREIERSEWKVTFEPLGGFDIKLSTRPNVFIELKPVVSDDYPAILRKICVARGRNNFDRFVLICDEFNSRAISFDQCAEIFNTQNIVLLRWSDLEKIQSKITEVGPNMYWVH